VRTVALETTVGVKVFPTVLVARAVTRERPTMRARCGTRYAKGLVGLFIYRSPFLSVDAAMNNRLPQRGLCRGDHQMGQNAERIKEKYIAK
jgi:hypothetical protein